MDATMTRAIRICAAAAFMVASAAVASAENVRIVPLVHGDEVVVSVELADAYTDDIRAAIASGLRTTFTYDVELRLAVPVWVDRTIATAVVSTSDQYDNLTRRHTLTRTVNGRVEQALVTDDESLVRRWLTTLTRMPLCRTSKLDPARDYYVRIRARSRPLGASLLGWGSTITGQAKFTFIP
jgi:hypothetical protein